MIYPRNNIYWPLGAQTSSSDASPSLPEDPLPHEYTSPFNNNDLELISI